MDMISKYRPEFGRGIFDFGPIRPLSEVSNAYGLLGRTTPTGTWNVDSPLYIANPYLNKYNPDFGPLDVFPSKTGLWGQFEHLSIPQLNKSMESTVAHEATHNLLDSPLFSDIASSRNPSYLSKAIGDIYNPGPRPALKKALEDKFSRTREPGPQEKYDVSETRPSPLEQKEELDYLAEQDQQIQINEIFNKFLDLDTPSEIDQKQAARWIELSRIFPSRPTSQLASILDVGARDPSELHKSGRVPVTVSPTGEPLSPRDPRVTGIMTLFQDAKDKYRDRLKRFKDVGLKSGEDPLYTVPFNKNIPMNLYGPGIF